MTADTWKAIDSRRTLKKTLIDTKSERLRERYQQQYSEADRQVKRLTRADKRTYVDGLAAEAEDVANVTSKGLYIQNNKTHLWKVSTSCQQHHQRQANIPSYDRDRARGMLDGTLQKDSEQTNTCRG